MPSVPRATVPASCEIGSARLNAKITSTMPKSIMVGMLISVSTSQLTFEPADQPVQDPRQQDHLQHERQGRRPVEVRAAP